MTPPKCRHAALALALLTFGTPSAMAGTFNFNGNLSQDDDVQFFTFTLANPSQVQIDTSSYAGGGFTPVLSLWNSAGISFGAMVGIGGLGGGGDVHWNIDLSYTIPDPTGVYYLALSENPNAAGGADLTFLPGGIPDTSIFLHNGQGNYTGLAATGFCNTDHTDGFYQPGGADCVRRSSAWNLDIASLGVTSAGLYPASTVPEPTTLALSLTGLAGFVPFARRRPA